jgi:hypothetical protein
MLRASRVFQTASLRRGASRGGVGGWPDKEGVRGWRLGVGRTRRGLGVGAWGLAGRKRSMVVGRWSLVRKGASLRPSNPPLLNPRQGVADRSRGSSASEREPPALKWMMTPRALASGQSPIPQSLALAHKSLKAQRLWFLGFRRPSDLSPQANSGSPHPSGGFKILSAFTFLLCVLSSLRRLRSLRENLFFLLRHQRLVSQTNPQPQPLPQRASFLPLRT